MNDIKVSIIIPVYNRSAFIVETLDSIYNSSLKNIQVICVDDGSVDDSVKIIKEYQKDKKNLILIENKHSGVSATRNKALDLCNSGYVAFLDSDDYLNDEVTDVDIEQAFLSDVDIISFDFFVDNKMKNTYERRSKAACCLNGGTENVRYGEKHFSSFLYKCSFLKNHGIRFYEGIQYNEDEVFRTYALYHSQKTLYIGKTWFTYNKHIDSLSHSNEKMKGTNHVLKVWNFAFDYFRANFPEDRYILAYCEEKIRWVKQKIANGGDN